MKEGLGCMLFCAVLPWKTRNLALPRLENPVHGFMICFTHVECRELLGVSPGMINSCISESANISADGAELATGAGTASPKKIKLLFAGFLHSEIAQIKSKSLAF